VGPRAGLDTVVKRKILIPSGFEPLTIQSVAQCYTTELFQLLLHKVDIKIRH
jgi:hypothetical protein